jgi:1-acyl-sn-glycerol-3-phosphate acyltransferase
MARTMIQHLLSFILSLYCWIVLASVTAFCFARAALQEPFKGRRAWTTGMHRWARGCIRWGLFRVRLDGDAPTSPAVLIANHQSVFDILLLTALLPPPVSFVARSDLAGIPIIGAVLRRGGHLLVGGSASKEALSHEATRRLEDGGFVVVFPEGSRSSSGTVRPFKAGAFHIAAGAGAPLVPVALAGTGTVVAKRSRLIRPAGVAVSFLAPLAPTGEDATCARYRDDARRLIEACVARTLESTGPRFMRRHRRRSRSMSNEQHPRSVE